MVGRTEALALLEKEVKEEKRVAHAQAVAALMVLLADLLNADPEEWYLTGLLHDIDLPETINHLEQHGIVAREKLRGLVPPEVIEAIMAHDPHTGIPATTTLAKALVFADNFINLQASVGQDLLKAAILNNEWRSLHERWPKKREQIALVQKYLSEWPVVIREMEQAGIL